MRCVCYGYGYDPFTFSQQNDVNVLEVKNDRDRTHMVYLMDHFRKDCSHTIHGVPNLCDWGVLVRKGDSKIFHCEGICSVATKDTRDTYKELLIRDPISTSILISTILNEGVEKPIVREPIQPPLPQQPAPPSGQKFPITVTNNTQFKKTVYVYSSRCKDTILGRPYICKFAMLYPFGTGRNTLKTDCPGECYVGYFEDKNHLKILPVREAANLSLSVLEKQGVRISREYFLESLGAGRRIL